jgi:Domain of unknown function (DUF4337)
MDVDPMEAVEAALEEKEEAGKASTARLNTWVAITVAIVATFMGICKVKDDNIVQAMQQAQADRIDYWSYYQARNVRQDVAEATLLQLRLSCPGAEAPKPCAEGIARYEKVIAEHVVRRAELKAKAEESEKRYDSLNFRDDQFDLSDAALAIAIAMLAVTALTRLWWLFFVSLVPTGFGVLMGLAGLTALPIHPDTLIKWLS